MSLTKLAEQNGWVAVHDNETNNFLFYSSPLCPHESPNGCHCPAFVPARSNSKRKNEIFIGGRWHAIDELRIAALLRLHGDQTS